MVGKKRSLVIFVVLMLVLPFVFAIDDLISLQGNVQESGVDVDSGNLTVSIYDSFSAGTLVYNSTTDFVDAISSGEYDVMLGNGTNELSLNYGDYYYMELWVNGEQISFQDGSTRQIFQSSVGNISLGDIDVGSDIVVTNDSVVFDSGKNVTLQDGWFFGLFNFFSGDSYTSFNGSTLTLTSTATQWFYNQTHITPNNGITLSVNNLSDFTFNYNQTEAGDSRFVNVDGDTAMTGAFEYGGGWASGGTTIEGGEIFTQTLYVVNVTSLGVSNLNINGSLTPQVGFDNTFDIGSPTKRYKDLFISNNLYSNGSIYGDGSQLTGISTFNSTYAEFAYNQTTPAIAYTDLVVSNNNASWSSTFNSTYDAKNTSVFLLNGADAYYNGGDVGIGTSTPGTADTTGISSPTILEVKSSSITTDAGLYLRRSDGAVGLDIWSKGATPYDSYFDNRYKDSDFIFRSNGSSASPKELLRIDGTSGNVGIGTATPNDILEINKVNNARLVIHQPNAVTATTYAQLVLTQGSTFFGASDKTWQFYSDGRSDGDADFAIQYWNNSTYSEKLRILSDGKVGIGTATPFDTLTVNGQSGNISLTESDSLNKAIQLVAQPTHGELDLYVSGSVINSHLDGFGDTYFNVNNGKVGIGTASPAQIFNVVKGAMDLRIYNDSASSTRISETSATNLVLRNDATNGSIWLEPSGTGTLYLNRYGGTGGIVFGNVTGTEQGKWTNDGKLGIGTTNPDQILEIEGGNIKLHMDSTNHAYLLLDRGNTGSVGAVQYQTAGTTIFEVGMDNNVSFPDYYIGNDGMGSKFLTVTTGGLVGIGTISPTHTLNVVGNINVTGYWDGDLQVRGNDIQSAGGTDAISLNGADVTVKDDLTVTTRIFATGSYSQFSRIHIGDGTDPGANNLIVDGNLSIAGNISDSNSDVTINDGLIVTGSISDSNSDVTINDGLIVSGSISTGGASAQTYNSFGAGTPGNLGTPTDDDVYIRGRLEVDGAAYLGTANSSTGTYWNFGDIAESLHTKESRENKFCRDDVECYLENTLDGLDYGDLVCIDSTEGQTIVKCSEANSKLAIGFISETAVLNVGTGKGYPIALAGIVPAKVTNENGDVMPGDLLVSSSKPGYAMKASSPAKDGTVVGKAFDFCSEDDCKIVVFVALS